jgi:hypothetical protein
MGASLAIPKATEGLAKTQGALEYALKLGAGQSRKDERGPFIPAVAFDLRARFGSRVAALVVAVSEDRHIAGYRARKAALRPRRS